MDPTPKSLQARKRKTIEWVFADPIPDGTFINVGDFLERWTNKRVNIPTIIIIKNPKTKTKTKQTKTREKEKKKKKRQKEKRKEKKKKRKKEKEKKKKEKKEKKKKRKERQ
jgi:hypothetical protein